jgi:hypothetical protein
MEGATVAKPERINYLAKVFHRKDQDRTKEVVSFDKGVKREDGEGWDNIKPAFIQYEDGSQVHFGDGPLTLRYLDDPKGNHFANIYQAIWGNPIEPGDEKDIPF